MERILAGPWVGEFGWELFCWQAYLRKLSLSGNNIVVVSRTSSEFLYRDFCHQYISFDPIGKNTDTYSCRDMREDFIIDNNGFNKKIDPRDKIVFYSPHSTKACINFFDQKFLKYGRKDCVKGYDIIIHARYIDRCSDRNWNLLRWQELVDRLLNDSFSIASVGAPNMASHISGTDNLMGINMEKLADVMANSRMAVGPSSGAMHYASLCGLPHVVWGSAKNRIKYIDHWNPFKTNVSFFSDQGWNPEVETVYKLIRKMLS